MRGRAFQIGVCACVVLFPCIPLRTGSLFYYYDWINHLWLIGYGAEAVRQGHTPPVALTTSELGGVPFSVFYGYLFYPILNVLAALVGLRNAVRVAVISVLVLQYALVHRAARGGGASNPLAITAAALTTWAIYPLTNLYHRGALTEFFAAVFLTCAMCRWFALLDANTLRQRLRAALEVGLLYALAAGCHPITALYGLFFMAALSLTTFARVGYERAPIVSRWLVLVPAAVLVLLILAPWAYACAQFNDKLGIHGLGILLFKEDIDRWWVRLFPLPLDVRMWRNSTGSVSTPHLDAQISMPLLILAAAVVWGAIRAGGRARLWLFLPLLLAAVCLWMSLRKSPYDMLPSLFEIVQFPYRLVTYVNLTLLAAILLALRLMPRSEPSGWARLSVEARTAIIACVLTLAAVGALAKILNVRNEIPLPPALEYQRFPVVFYGWYGYATPGLYRELNKEEEDTMEPLFLQTAADDPHRYAPTVVKIERAKYVAVQVQTFPWSHFAIDGERVPDTELRLWKGRSNSAPGTDWSRGPYFVLPIPAGSHVIEHHFEPDPVWLALYRISFVSLLVGVLFLCWSSAFRRFFASTTKKHVPDSNEIGQSSVSA